MYFQIIRYKNWIAYSIRLCLNVRVCVSDIDIYDRRTEFNSLLHVLLRSRIHCVCFFSFFFFIFNLIVFFFFWNFNMVSPDAGQKYLHLSHTYFIHSHSVITFFSPKFQLLALCYLFMVICVSYLLQTFYLSFKI